MGEDLEVLIQKKEKEFSPLCSRMEDLKQQFTSDTTEFAAKWYEQTAKEYATKYPEITLSLTKEKLAAMKAKVNNLTKNASKIVKEALSNQDIWWHQTPQLHDSFSQYEQLGNNETGNKFPQKIDDPVRRALGELGTILEQFEFNVTTNPSLKAAYPEFWFNIPKDPQAEAQPYFPHLLVWSEEMQSNLQKYNGQFKQAIVLFNEIQKLKEEKKKLQASQLWDST